MGGPQVDTDVGCKVFIGAEVVVENGEDHRGSDGAVGGEGSADTVDGTVLDTLQLSSAVGLVNGYFDLLPRGMFTPMSALASASCIAKSRAPTSIPRRCWTVRARRYPLGRGQGQRCGPRRSTHGFMDKMSSTINTNSFVSSTTQHSVANRRTLQHLVTLSLSPLISKERVTLFLFLPLTLALCPPAGKGPSPPPTPPVPGGWRRHRARAGFGHLGQRQGVRRRLIQAGDRRPRHP
jgi:hypothetical protein